MPFEEPPAPGAVFDLLRADEALGPADDAGAALTMVGRDLINVRTYGYVAGTRQCGNEGSSRMEQGSPRRNEESSWGNEGITAGERRIMTGE